MTTVVSTPLYAGQIFLDAASGKQYMFIPYSEAAVHEAMRNG